MSSEIEQLEEFGRRARQEYLKSLLFLPNPIANKAQTLISSITNAELSYYIELKGGSGDTSLASTELRKNLAGNYAKETADLAEQLRFLLGVENLEAKV